MTRAEFLQRRAVMDFERRHGITVCPPAGPDDPEPITARANTDTIARSIWARAGFRNRQHVTDESRAAIPVRVWFNKGKDL